MNTSAGEVLGACALFYGSLLLVREARLAVVFPLEEMAFAREAVGTARPEPDGRTPG